MSSVPATNFNLTAAMMETVLVAGDLKALSPSDRVGYYRQVCESLGLNPLTQPFAYINLNGKLTLYAKRDCTDQLRKIHNISVRIVSRECIEGCYVVTANAKNPLGREDESLGAVPIENLKGEARANAMMKAETKAKRRVTLGICGLAMLDETEVESVKGYSHVTVDDQGRIACGSTEAAQAVAQAKIEGTLPLEPSAEQVEAIVEAAPAAEKPKKAPKPFNKFEAFNAIGLLKDQFEAMGMVEAYYEVLKHYGVEKRNQLPTNDGGNAFRACYKDMGAALATVREYYNEHQFKEWCDVHSSDKKGHTPIWVNGVKWVYDREKSSYDVADAG